MDLSTIQQQALRQWHDFGTTTPTHPVLQFAYNLYLEPLGLQCDALVYDALAAIENKELPLNLVAPRWNSKKVDRAWGQFKTVEPLVNLAHLIDPIFSPQGHITQFNILKDFSATDESNSIMGTIVDSTEQKLVESFQSENAEAIVALSENLAIATKLFIDTSLELMIRPEPISSEFAKIFANNPKHYSAIAFEVFTKRPQSA